MLERAAWGGLATAGAAAPAASVLGVAWDGGVGWRPGAAEAPARLREISTTSPCVSEDGFVVDPARFRVHDLGDVAPPGPLRDEAAREAWFARVQERASESLRCAPFALGIGGDHSVSIPLLRAFAAEAAVALARERLAGVERVYLTIDVDVADPACAPGTGAPVAGGPSSRELLDLVRGLMEALPVRAADLVEVSPPLDPSGATLFLALQIVFEMLAARARAEQPAP